MSQLSKRTDDALHELSRKIGTAEKEIQKATKDKDLSWEEVFEIFAEHYRERKEARFIANDGYYLQRQLRQPPPKLDEQRLHDIIMLYLPAGKATRVWNSITERSVNSAKLEKAVQEGKLEAEWVADCITLAEPIVARVRRLWTKEDVDRAAVLNIKIVPQEE